MREPNDEVVAHAWDRGRRVKADLCRVEQGEEGLIAAALIDFVRPVEEDRLHLQSALAAIVRMRGQALKGERNYEGMNEAMREIAETAMNALRRRGPWGTREEDVMSLEDDHAKTG